MEPVGLTASVLTLILGADFIRRTLDDIKKGGKDRERLLIEIKSLQSVLDRLKADGDQARASGKQEAWLDIVGPLSSKGGPLECIGDVFSEIKLRIEPKQGLRGAMIRWTWPFVKEDVDRNVKQMQRLSHSVSLAVQDASFKLMMAMNERVTHLDKITNKHELRAILQWLSSLNFLEQQRLEYSKAMPGTCEWFLSSLHYSAWKQEQHRVLYCSAIGGAGKTILASVAVDDLRMQFAGQDVGIFSIYCKHDRPDTHSAEKLAMAMLRQLIQLKACVIPPDLEEVLEKHYYTNDTRPEYNETLKVINAHLPTFSKSFIVLDGLDEIMDEKAREQIITFLLKLEGEPQVMFTSRPLDLIEKIFHPRVSDQDSEEIELSDEEEEGSDCWTEYDAQYENYLGSVSFDYEDMSEPSSDEEDAEMDANLHEYPTSFTPDAATTQSDDPGLPTPPRLLQQSDELGICSKCRKNLASLQYHCQKCRGSRPIVCINCYDCGIRCVSGDSSHDIHVIVRVPCLKMDVSARPRAIRTYVRRRTQQSPVLLNFVKLKPGFAEEIEEVVTQAAQKMFLLAQLHMDAMSDTDLLKFSEVHDALLNLPSGLDDSYDKAMKRLQAHGKSLLRLVAYSQRPLHIQEVEQALGVSSGAYEILDEEIIPASTLVSRCAGLVTFDENHQVVFSHYTIVGYFAKRRDDLFSNGNTYMAGLCLNYLGLGEFRRGPVHGDEEGALFDARLKANPFLEYASLFWGVHAKASEDEKVLELAYELIKDDECRNASIQALWFSSDEVTGNWRSRSEASPLHLAMYFKYTKLANRLLEDGADANIQDAFGMTSLMWAAQVGDKEMTKKVLRMRIPLNAMNHDGENALHLAINQRHEDIAELLIDEPDMNVNAPANGERGTSSDVTPLMLAIGKEEANVVQKLLNRKDILVDAKDNRGWSAMHRAALVDNPSFMEALVAIPSIDLDCPDKFGCPPLIVAARYGNTSAVAALLDAGANINIREDELGARGNALMRAADYDRVGVVHLLIKRGIDWNAKDTMNRSAVHSASINGSARSLAALLGLPNIDINLQDVYGNTPLHDAAGHFNYSVLQILLDKGVSIGIRNRRGKTPLDTARANGENINVSILKEKYAEELAMPKRSLTGMSLQEPSLIQAAQQGDEAAVDSILATYKEDKTINIEEKDDWLGRTPLQHATDAGFLRIVKKLHKAGASVNVQDRFGRTAIHIAAMRDRLRIARYFLRNGVDMTLKDQWGVGVMEDADPALQVLLLECGIEITNDQDLDGLIGSAAQLGSMKAVHRLIGAGADIQVKDRFGLSAYGRAKQAGKTEVAKYLDRVGRSEADSKTPVPTPVTSSDSINTLNATMDPEPIARPAEKEVEQSYNHIQRCSESQNNLDNHTSAVTASNTAIAVKNQDTLLKNESPGGKPAVQLSSSRSSLTNGSTREGGKQIIHVTWDWNYLIIFIFALLLGLFLK